MAKSCKTIFFYIFFRFLAAATCLETSYLEHWDQCYKTFLGCKLYFHLLSYYTKILAMVPEL
jgi:hypothetical protein